MRKRPITRLIRATGIATAALLTLAACVPNDGQTSDVPSNGTPVEGGELHVLMLQDALTLDPALNTQSAGVVFLEQMFDTLVDKAVDGSIIPSLATKWTISDDGLTYTFYLAEGVTFHNGRAFTSEDVKYTIERIQDPQTGSSRAKNFGPVSSIDTPDAQTVVFNLSESFAPLLANLSHVSSAPVPKEVIEENGDLGRTPVGTGPFELVEWRTDQSITVKKYEGYWREGPYLDSIVFTFNSDANARAAALRAGDVDFLYDAPTPLIDILRADTSLQVQGGEGSTNWLYLLLNQQKAPFDDIDVRQAIYTALDRQALADTCQPGTSSVLNGGFLPPSHWAGVTDTVYSPDLEKARQLLRTGGQDEGFSFTINALAGWDFQICTAQLVQEQLKPLDIDVKINVMESGQLSAASQDGSFEAQVLGFSGTIDPDERFQQSMVAGGGTNYAQFEDAQVTAFVAQARAESDQEVRAELYRKAQLRVAEVGPWAFLYVYQKFDVVQSYVQNYKWNPGPSYRSLREIWLD